jgi:cytochrome b
MSAEPSTAEAVHERPARVWDAPTRMFHWALVAAIAGAWLTRDARDLVLHEFLGYAAGALVAFRLAWGFAGTRWARFASFPLSARAAVRYLASLARGRHERHVGHNPAGSWAIYALLALIALDAAAGLVALGAEKRLGPLAGWFGYAAGDAAHEAHRWLAYAIFGIAVLHLLGVIAGSVAGRENLVAAMLTGRKRVAGAGVEARIGTALLMAAILAAGAAAYFRDHPLDARVQAARQAPLASDGTWVGECGGCHLAYHPSLLPARSWSKLFATQHSHFGEDLALEGDTLARLEAFAAAHAAERLESPVAWKMATTVERDAAPLRITETAFWRERHERVDAAAWKRVHRSECGACHQDAARGTFAPAAIEVRP